MTTDSRPLSVAGSYTLYNVTELAAAVLRNAVKEGGPSYMLDPCARWWCDVLDMNPAFLYREASTLSGQLRDYKPRRYCIRNRPRDRRGRFVKAS